MLMYYIFLSLCILSRDIRFKSLNMMQCCTNILIYASFLIQLRLKVELLLPFHLLIQTTVSSVQKNYYISNSFKQFVRQGQSVVRPIDGKCSLDLEKGFDSVLYSLFYVNGFGLVLGFTSARKIGNLKGRHHRQHF